MARRSGILSAAFPWIKTLFLRTPVDDLPYRLRTRHSGLVYRPGRSRRVSRADAARCALGQPENVRRAAAEVPLHRFLRLLGRERRGVRYYRMQLSCAATTRKEIHRSSI